MNIRFYIVLLAIIVVGYSQVGHAAVKTNTTAKTTSEQSAFGRVIRVYDGDTIAVRIENKIEKIRLLGIDTPEIRDKRGISQCYSKDAKKFLISRINNKTVRLTRDSISKNRDVYGRLLRYVYVESNLINAELLTKGYAYTYTRSPIEKLDRFLGYEKNAKKYQKGIWNIKTCAGKRYK